MDNKGKVIKSKNNMAASGSEGQKNYAGGKKSLLSIIVFVIIALIALFKPELLESVLGSSEQANVRQYEGEGLYVAFIDVGQGDSIFLRSPSGKTMLVDAGTPDSFENIQAALSANNVTKLDAVIMTHPHSDHMGSMKKVIENYDIGTFYMPDAVNTTSSFEKMLTALEKRDVNTKVIWGGANSTISWDEAIEVRVLSPLKGEDYNDDLNNMSLVLRVAYGDTSLLLTGDAEKMAEDYMLESEKELLRADILKLGHHGSSTSSSQAFLDAVQPEAVVISLGKNNDYGHPHKETMQRLNKLDIKIYRTDELGTVEMLFTGDEIRLLSGE